MRKVFNNRELMHRYVNGVSVNVEGMRNASGSVFVIDGVLYS